MVGPFINFFFGFSLELLGVHLQGLGSICPLLGCPLPPFSFPFPCAPGCPLFFSLGNLQGVELTHSSLGFPIFGGDMALPPWSTPITIWIPSFSVFPQKVMGESVSSFSQTFSQASDGTLLPTFCIPQNMMVVMIEVRNIIPAAPSFSVVIMLALHAATKQQKKHGFCPSRVSPDRLLQVDARSANILNQKNPKGGPKKRAKGYIYLSIYLSIYICMLQSSFLYHFGLSRVSFCTTSRVRNSTTFWGTILTLQKKRFFEDFCDTFWCQFVF